MKASKVSYIVQALALTILSSLSLTLYAEGATYQVEKAEYVNSMHGAVEALCNPGDEMIEGSCEGTYRGISPRSVDVDYPLDTESMANGYRCKPKMLRADQILMVIVEVTCHAPQAKTAKVARVNR